MRERSYFRHQRERAIQKRINIIKRVWKSLDNILLDKPGILAKDNLACSCWMCKEGRQSHVKRSKKWLEEHLSLQE